MSKSIKHFKNSDEIIQMLENERKLVFVDIQSKEIFKDYLNQYGYFSFVKKLSNNLMYEDIENKIYNKEITSNNIRYLFDIERHIAVVIYKYFKNIEYSFNSTILKTISKYLNKYTGCPYLSAISDDHFDKLFKNLDNSISEGKKRNSSNVFSLFYDFYKNVKTTGFDYIKTINENMNNENEEVINIIKNGWFGNFIKKNRASQKTYIQYNWEYLDIFSLFQTITFSQLKRIFGYLSLSHKTEIGRNLLKAATNWKTSKILMKEEAIMFLFEVFSNLRNIIMHNGSAIKFNIKFNDDKIEDCFVKWFGMEFINSEIRLKEIIEIMEKIINIPNRIINEINQRINDKFENRTARPDAVSKIIFEIIKDETRIDLDISKQQN